MPVPGNTPSSVRAPCALVRGAQNAIQREQSRPEPKAQMDVTYTPGQRVRHKAFGDGTVLAVNGGGASSIVEIAFDNGANKKFAAAFAPIEVVKD